MTADQIRQVVEQTARSRYWRQHDAEIILASVKHTGLTMAAFAREYGLSVQRLRRWHQLLGDVDPSARAGDETRLPGPHFHPVHVIVGDGARAGPTFELVLRGGRRIAVSADFDEDSLERLVRFTERLGC